jgi:hypothetical protein
VTDGAAFLGRWSESDGRLVEVIADGADLIMRYPGVPAEFAPRVVPGGPADPAAFVLCGGPRDGLCIAVADRDGVPQLVIGNTLSMRRWADGPAHQHAVQGVPGPPTVVEPAAEAAYRQLLDRALAAHGGVVQPPAGCCWPTGWGGPAASR